MNNIFKFSPKELVMDAFFAWLFKELYSNPSMQKYQVAFLKNLNITGLSSPWSSCEVEKQKENTDLVVTINEKEILFENKTISTIHGSKYYRNQLHKYKTILPHCYKYIYMKLSFIDYEENKIAVSEGYSVVTSQNIQRALDPFKSFCQIVEQYYEYLDDNFLKKENTLFSEMETNCSVYKYSVVQRKFLSDLYMKLDGHLKDMKLNYASNIGGSNWTQLRIAMSTKKYGTVNEYIFWRIDKKKKGGYYIKLTQYANIDSSYQLDKETELKRLRKIFDDLVAIKYSLISAKCQKRGMKSSEIGLFYCKDNSYYDLATQLVDFSKDFVAKY